MPILEGLEKRRNGIEVLEALHAGALQAQGRAFTGIGAVFVMTNNAERNEVIACGRDPSGMPSVPR